MVTLIALLIGVGFGSIASEDISNNLLANQIELSVQQAEEMASNFGGRPGGVGLMMPRGGPGADPIVDYVDVINATVNLEVMGQLVLVGISLAMVSSLVAIIFVMRYEPLKILSERA